MKKNVHDVRYQGGFSALELVIVVAIIFILIAVAMPNMMRLNDNEKLRGAAQSYAYLLELARTRAANDNTAYEILNTTSGNTPIIYVDVNDNGHWDNDGTEPDLELPKSVTITDTGAPAGFDTTTYLGLIPLYAGTGTYHSPMVNNAGAATPGLAFNERGLPCQRVTTGGNCTNLTTLNSNPYLTAWVTYLKYQNYDGTTGWAAVTVTPAGRIKSWLYQGGTWQ